MTRLTELKAQIAQLDDLIRTGWNPKFLNAFCSLRKAMLSRHLAVLRCPMPMRQGRASGWLRPSVFLSWSWRLRAMPGVVSPMRLTRRRENLVRPMPRRQLPGTSLAGPSSRPWLSG